MIDYIMGGEYLTVTSNKGAQPYINKGSGQPMIGAVSYDSNSQSMKVYDGSTWMTVGGGSATVNLNGNAISIFKWAEQKMREEQNNHEDDLEMLQNEIQMLNEELRQQTSQYENELALKN